MKYLTVLFSFLVFVSCKSDSDDVAPIQGPTTNVSGVISDVVGDVPIVVYAHSGHRMYVAFERRTESSEEILEITVSQSGSPAVFSDQHGNDYDISGQSITVPGERLKSVEQVVGYWFFFPAFYEGVELISGEMINNSNYPDDLINTEFLFAGSFRDGIPSIDNPEFRALEGRELIEEPFYSNLPTDELVSVVSIGSNNYVYPHRILEYHEVANSIHGSVPITMSYCPLTGTAKAWSRIVEGKQVEFGVSGLLYNNNLILYDRVSETNWSQILSVGIEGEYKSSRPTELTMVEMSLQTAGTLGGTTHYLTANTGFNFDYSSSLYDNYKSDERVSFPLTNSSTMFHPKERLIGIPYGNNVKVYRFEDFE